MTDVEKVARDTADAMFFGPHKPDCEIPEDQTMQVRYGHAVKVIRDALAAMGGEAERCDCGHTIDDCATRPGLRHCEKVSGEAVEETVKAERERCARIADSGSYMLTIKGVGVKTADELRNFEEGVKAAETGIAAAIRGKGE